MVPAGLHNRRTRTHRGRRPGRTSARPFAGPRMQCVTLGRTRTNRGLLLKRKTYGDIGRPEVGIASSETHSRGPVARHGETRYECIAKEKTGGGESRRHPSFFVRACALLKMALVRRAKRRTGIACQSAGGRSRRFRTNDWCQRGCAVEGESCWLCRLLERLQVGRTRPRQGHGSTPVIDRSADCGREGASVCVIYAWKVWIVSADSASGTSPWLGARPTTVLRPRATEASAARSGRHCEEVQWRRG